MDSGSFFGLSPQHVLMAAIGGVIFAAYWLPRLVSPRAAASSALLMIFGLVAYAVIPGMPEALDPTASPRLWELTSEIVLIVVLFATGLRIDNIGSYRLWQPTVRMLLIAMPLTIAAVAGLAWGLAGMTISGAVLLGAVLAPTDPVLAGDVQVGPPLEGNGHPLRFTLTAEAGLNDGLAFPFVYLGLLLCYGLVELAEGYGFIGAFVAGLVCRRVQERHHFHRRLHTFSEAIEHALTAILLVLVGSTLPALWPALDWRHSVIGFSLILVIRLLAGWLALQRTPLARNDRWIVSFFGVRGIGSIYYIAYASGHMEFVNENQLWALVAYTVFASAVIHGVTSFLVDRFASRPGQRPAP